jgi:type III pantothenate kinase
MLLACDIGNTNIKTGLFSDDKLTETQLFNSTESFSSYISTKSIDNIAVSSVVPELTGKIIAASKGTIPFVITRDVKFNLKISYDSPETLGIDRMCSAEGAFSLYKNSGDFENFNNTTYILSINMGTATTINIVSFPGEFSGGIIAPGISMMFDSLNHGTALLPNVSEKSYENYIGRNTASSIASGVINSANGLIKDTIGYLKSAMNAKELKIYISGGNAGKLIPHFDFEYQYVPELVLLGIKTIYNKNFPKS